MRENTIKTIWKNGGVVVNGWLHIPSTWSTEVMSHQGWDSLTIDMQHGMMGIETAIQMLQAVSTTDTIPIVRVTWNEPGLIMRMLDAGAYGIICPMINTRAECEAFVGACRYPPLGFRSLGPTRARVYAGPDYAHHANDTIVTFAMVETKEALNNIEAIVSVPGLDAVFVGMGDLRLSLKGEIGLDSTDPEMMQAVDDIQEACEKHGVAAGIFAASTEFAGQMIERGYRFITVKTDTALLAEAAQQAVNNTRNTQARR